jgi:CDP-glucose 4,6-dehydratase
VGVGSSAMVGRVTPDPGFWRGRRVFLTGHTGFKGAWLAAWLERLGARLFGYALAPETEPALASLLGLDRRFDAMIGDLDDTERLLAAMTGFAPEIVLHLAAQSLVLRSHREPIATFRTNVMGTANVLEAVRQTPSIRAVIVVTSDKCYENHEWSQAFRETDPLGGGDPYSASKACAELVTAAWRHSFLSQVAVASARAGNVIGGGDWAPERLIPDCIAALTAGQPIALRRPEATRPWQHVLDPLAGYLILAERLAADGNAYAQGWNFGPSPDAALPVRRIAEAVIAAWGSGSWVAGEPGPPEAGRLAVDASLARQRLGWVQHLDLDAALSWTVEWYRRHWQGEDAVKLVNEQIDAYHARAGTPG